MDLCRWQDVFELLFGQRPIVVASDLLDIAEGCVTNASQQAIH